MPIAIWPPGNPVRFSYWNNDDSRRARRACTGLGVVVEAEYAANGYVAIQSLVDLTIHRFQFDAAGDYRWDSFPRGDGFGEPVEVTADEVRAFLATNGGDQLDRRNAHARLATYLKSIDRIACLA